MKYINCENLDVVCLALENHQAKLITAPEARKAAVALVLRQGEQGAEVLFIQRAPSPDDPWSGQIAFPGGGLEPEDRDLAAAAMRETREEVGLALHGEQLVARLDDQQGRNNNRSLNLVISCHVYQIDNNPALMPNYEVAEAFWTPLINLIDAGKHQTYLTDYRPEPFPAVDLGKGGANQPRILWGLTYRFVAMFFDAVDSNVWPGEMYWQQK